MDLWIYLKNKMQKHLDREICENDSSITYEEMIIYAEQFAKKLSGLKCVAIMCRSEMAAGMALLGCFAAGVTIVPLASRYGFKHCDKIINAVKPEAIITDTYGELCIYNFEDAAYTDPKIHPALIMCTSGTTGEPKGVMLSEKNILTNIIDISSYFAINATDTILIARPLYHCAVLTGEFLTGLIKGARIRFYSEKFNPTVLFDIIEKYKITVFCGTPTLLSLMARLSKNRSLETLRHICISGECMSAEVGSEIANSFDRSNIYHVYGLTEACPRVAYLPPSLFRRNPDCVGMPLRSVSIKIMSDEGKNAKTNEIGMLWIKGNNVMLGYYNDPIRTSETLKDGWLCTGDLACINEKGLLKIKGRSDDLIIKAGMNIYPQEIESELKKDSRVKELYVYGYKDKRFGTQIGLNIVGDFCSTSEIRKLCRSRLPIYQMPTKINLVDKLPKNGFGKIIRR